MIKKLLFDADGTLWDFDASARLGFETIFARRGWDYTPAFFDGYTRINNGLWERYERGEMSRDRVLVERFDLLFAELGIEASGAAFEDEFRVELESNPVWMDGAEELLKVLRPDYEIYVVTNGVASTQRKRIAITGLDRYVDEFFISEEIGAQKPQKAYFDYCLSHIGPCEKEKILLVGGSDSYGDVTPVAERNIYEDPESAQHVFLSGIPIVMFGLNVTRNLENRALLPLAYLFKPQIFDTEECGVFVETKAAKTRGMTVTDLYSDKQFDKHYVEMVKGFDREKLGELLKHA